MGLDVIKSKKLVKDMMFNHPKDLPETFDRAEGFIAVEESMSILKPRATEKPNEQDRSGYPKKDNNNRWDGHKKGMATMGVREEVAHPSRIRGSIESIPS